MEPRIPARGTAAAAGVATAVSVCSKFSAFLFLPLGALAIGALAMVYFLLMSTLAMAIGLPIDATVTLRYAGASWTRVTADGRLAFEGTPGASQRRTFTAKRSLELVLGYPAGVRLTVNGHDLGVPDRSGSIWRRSFTPASRSLG